MHQRLFSQFKVAGILATTLAGPHQAHADEIPLSWRIGNVSTQFNLSPAETEKAIKDAIKVWERHTFSKLFVYMPESEKAFKIEFVDNGTHKKVQLRAAELRKLNEISLEIDKRKLRVAELLKQYEQCEEEYKQASSKYEDEVTEYNKEVDVWNRKGGAPPEVIKRLNARQNELDRDRIAVNNLGAKLDEAAERYKSENDNRNRLVRAYNETVELRNLLSTVSTETLGRCYLRGKEVEKVEIYAYADSRELVAVLAHELGHALGMDHVDDKTSIMSANIPSGPGELRATNADLEELRRCLQKGVVASKFFQHPFKQLELAQGQSIKPSARPRLIATKAQRL